jgi:hypothetical protein
MEWFTLVFLYSSCPFESLKLSFECPWSLTASQVVSHIKKIIWASIFPIQSDDCKNFLCGFIPVWDLCFFYYLQWNKRLIRGFQKWDSLIPRFPKSILFLHFTIDIPIKRFYMIWTSCLLIFTNIATSYGSIQFPLF